MWHYTGVTNVICRLLFFFVFSELRWEVIVRFVDWCICAFVIDLLYKKSWPWSYGSWIYNYLCNQCLSPLMLLVRISIIVDMFWPKRLVIAFHILCFAFIVHYVIKFVSDLWKVSGFLWVLRFLPPLKLTPITLTITPFNVILLWKRNPW